MQETFDGLGMERGGPNKAIVKAMKLKWKESDIVAFQSEIEDLRSELMLNLILWLRFVHHSVEESQSSQSLMLMIEVRTGMMKSLDNQDSMIQEFSKVRRHDEDLRKRLDTLVQKQEGFVQQMVQILSSNATSVVRSIGYDQSQTLQLETDLMNAMHNSPQQMEGEDLSRLKMSPNRLARVRNQFINIFRYDTMFDREAGVAEAHPDTLKWIFRSPGGEAHTWDHLGQWLESEDQLYWITGKMGSGKSTLMKYISEELPATSGTGTERRSTPHLLRWAKSQPLFIATFYFWAGSSEETRIQTSVQGLYRTLLTQMLEAYPDAAPHVSPHRWENICLFNKDSKPPGITELKTTLAKAIDYVSSLAKICLFIDGLDEFEGESEDLMGLVTWVKVLVETSPVKLCVASRPWRVFEDALQDRPHLLMEDFNFKDIQKYVWRRFHDDPNFRDKKLMDAAFCNQLLNEIVTKAEGVFLWVHLVCTRLLQGMSSGELVGDLRKILNGLPLPMEKLYGHILDNLDLKDHAAKYFLLLQSCLGRPDALIFSFADDIGEDSEFALKLPKEDLTDLETRYRVTELRKRLNSRCKGLLSHSVEALDFRETTTHSNIGTVQYCHRSAKDYLETAIIREKLVNMLDTPFDAHLRLCSAHLARWKCYPSLASDLKWHPSIYKCAEHAAKVASDSSDMMIRVLDNLDPDFRDSEVTIDHYFKAGHWFGSTLLSLTVALGVSEYVKFKVGRGQGCIVRSPSVFLNSDLWPSSRDWRPGQDRTSAGTTRMREFHEAKRGAEVEWPLLLDALLSRSQPVPEMASLLLENGADPNLIVRCHHWEESAFSVVLDHASIKPSRGDMDRVFASDAKKAWVDSLCLLLRYGAKPHRSDVQFLREFIGKDLIHTLKLPHLGRHRKFISKRLAFAYGDGGNLGGRRYTSRD